VEEIEQSKSRQLVEHEQQPMRAALGLEVLGETMVEDQSHQRLGTADVLWRYDELERRWPGSSSMRWMRQS
jgi:hypothetical protein